MKLKIGIFFGGPSRLREQSFQSARSVFLNLDRTLFEPIPILVSSRRQFFLSDWADWYRSSLHSFSPPADVRPPSRQGFPMYEESLGDLPEEEYLRTMSHLGRALDPAELPQLINFAVLTLEGLYGEDGTLQSELDALRIPYTGGSARVQRQFFHPGGLYSHIESLGLKIPDRIELNLEEWHRHGVSGLLEKVAGALGFPFKVYPVSDPANAAFIDSASDEAGFQEALEAAFFQERIPLRRWQSMSLFDRADHIRFLTDLRAGLGFPVHVSLEHEHAVIAHPEELLHYLNSRAADAAFEDGACLMRSTLPEEYVVLESCTAGEPFAVAVCRGKDGQIQALPPLRINQGAAGFEHEALAGGIFGGAEAEAIRGAAIRLYELAALHNTAIVEGKIGPSGDILIERLQTGFSFRPSDPLFLSGLLADQLPAAWLTALIRLSLQARALEQPEEYSYRGLQDYLDEALQADKATEEAPAIGIAAAFPKGKGFPESALHMIQYLGAEGQRRIIPLRVSSSQDGYQLEAVSLEYCWLGTESANGLRKTPEVRPEHLFLDQGSQRFTGVVRAEALSGQMACLLIDSSVETANGALQRDLKHAGIPFSGPDAVPAGLAQQRFLSLDALRRNTDLLVSEQLFCTSKEFDAGNEAFLQRVESRFTYPFLAFPAGSGPLIIHNKAQLEACVRLCFRPKETAGDEFRRILRLRPGQLLPIQQDLLFQDITRTRGAKHFVPVSIGLLCFYDERSNLTYQTLEPSERAAPWYAITEPEQAEEGSGPKSFPPARLDAHPERQAQISQAVRDTAEMAGRILHLQGVGIIEAVVRIFDTGRVETVIEGVQAFPSWDPEAPLIRQLAYQGLFPGEVLIRIIDQSQGRYSLNRRAKEAQNAYIALQNTFAVKPPDESELVPEQQEENEPLSMEPGPPPTPERRNPLDMLPKLPSTGIMGAIRESLLNVWYFVSSTFFLKNLAAAGVLIAVLFALTTLGLKLYTHHGQSVEVQDYRGMTLREGKRKAEARSFEIVMNDSMYIVGKAPGIILDQTPKPASRIKKNRNIYLTVSSGTPPEVPLPDLIGGNDDFEQYNRKLERLGVNARIKDREFNAELEDNTILYLLVEGRRINARDLKRGVKVPKGSTIDVVVSIRNTGSVEIPNLVCLTYEEAIFLLRSSQLVIGSVFAQGEPLPWLYVYKQDPGYNPDLKLSVGEQINLYLTESRPAGCDEQ